MKTLWGWIAITKETSQYRSSYSKAELWTSEKARFVDALSRLLLAKVDNHFDDSTVDFNFTVEEYERLIVDAEIAAARDPIEWTAIQLVSRNRYSDLMDLVSVPDSEPPK